MNILENSYTSEVARYSQLIPETKTRAIDKKRKYLHIENKIERGIDIIGGIVGVSLLIPLTLCIYVARVITGDRGPIFYSQERIGQDGKIFKLYKFRSMVENADEKLNSYLEQNEEARQEYKLHKKLENDPRITKIGKFIRKTSLDEFPQFINVLKGEMGLVGPRPYLPREKADMGEKYHKIVKCRPGITGYWQVNGRSNTTFEERLEMEKYYSENYNIKMDMNIFLKTFKVALVNKDAK